MKRAISIILLFVLVYNQCGFLAMLHYQQAQRRAIARQVRMDYLWKHAQPQQILQIAIHQNELENYLFLDDGKELMYRGDLYDILKQESNQGVITYYCIADKQEKQILGSMADQMKCGDHQKQLPVKDILKKNPVFSSDYMPAEQHPAMTLFIEHRNVMYPEFSNELLAGIYEHPSPPPKSDKGC